MKSILLFCMFVIFSEAGIAQVNLVPNPSFEDYSICPTGFDQIDRANGWSSYGGSPDYFNSCANIPSNNTTGVPQNTWGYQYAKDGNGYAFIITYDIQSLPYNTREYIGIDLSHSLIIGTKYFISAFVSRTESVFTKGATNNFGFRLTSTQYTKFNPFAPDNFAHVKCDSIVMNQFDWTQVFGSFISDSTYTHLMIGNFFDNLNTDTAQFDQFSGGYYVDAICLSTDSLFAKTWTSQTEIETENIKAIFSHNHLRFLDVRNETTFTLFDITGKEVFQGAITEQENDFYLPTLSQSIYFIRLNNSFGIKLLIFH